MKASEYLKVDQAIATFTSYGFDIVVDNGEFLMRGDNDAVACFETTQELCAAAYAYDLGRTHGDR